MSVLEKVNSQTRAVLQMMFDKEPLNYIEAASLYGVVSQGRLNMSLLEALYNHARDSQLRKLIRESIENHTELTIEMSENLLEKSQAPLPNINLPNRHLHNQPLDVNADASLTDMEIAATIGTMAKGSQMALLGALLNSYQLEVAMMLRKRLDSGLDWNYRLLQLMLDRGWLPQITKISH